MKKICKGPILGLGLGGVLWFVTLVNLTAQTFTTLHSFSGKDGSIPFAGLTKSGNVLYGTTLNGGTHYEKYSGGAGSVFAVNADGTGFTNLHFFNFDDGSGPSSPLVLDGKILYGTTGSGGQASYGVVFAINIDGTGFTNLHSFTPLMNIGTNQDGAFPLGLAISGDTLYGTTQVGGGSGNGTIFAIRIDGTGFTNLHSFTSSEGSPPPGGASLVVSNNTLYGVAARMVLP